jgi:hypothetical protein
MHEHVAPVMEKVNPGPYILKSPIGYPFRVFLEKWHEYQNHKRQKDAGEGQDE